MNNKTLKLTTGAMCVAIFGVMLLLNRQTAGFFEEVMLFLFPIPMVAFGAQYGLKNSLPVFAAMILITVVLGAGMITTIFYATTEAFIGLMFGYCLNKKLEMTKTLFVVMILSTAANLMCTIVLASVFGNDLNTQITEMQEIMTQSFEQAGMVLPEGLLSVSYLRRMMVISMAFLGMFQGFVVYELSLIILKRLKFPVQKPKSVFLFFPPKWTGVLAAVAFCALTYSFARPIEDKNIYNIVQTVGLIGYIYLISFGFICVMLLIKQYFPKSKGFCVILAVISIFILPQFVIIMGVIYISTGYHKMMLERYQQLSGQGDQSRS